MTGNWTDNTITNTSSGIARTNNVPGDGKFDNSTFPGDVELEVGRIDFANLSSFAETEMLIRSVIITLSVGVHFTLSVSSEPIHQRF